MSLWSGSALAFTIPCRWTSDQAKVVLEIPSESSKSSTDAEPCTLRSLMIELEEEGHVDMGLHKHKCDRPPAAGDEGREVEMILIKQG